MKCCSLLNSYKDKLHKKSDQRGAALIEFAIILPLLALLAFVAVDFGRLFHARLIVTNVCREGGSIASRQLRSTDELLDLLQASGEPLDLQQDGRIYITRVRAATGIPGSPYEDTPRIINPDDSNRGSLTVSSSINEDHQTFGFSPAIFEYLQYNEDYGTSIISELVIVEVYYRFQPITPLPGFLINNMFNHDGGMIFSSRSVMQYVDR